MQKTLGSRTSTQVFDENTAKSLDIKQRKLSSNTNTRVILGDISNKNEKVTTEVKKSGVVAPLDPMDTIEDTLADISLSPRRSFLCQQQINNFNAQVEANLKQLDARDVKNSQLCAEYADEILQYWRSVEMRRAPSPTYMAKQADINPRMREILVDWMIEVQLKFKLKVDTLFLSIHILDRFLERRSVTRTKLQLVGCTALLLAAKYEEIYAPEILDFVSISDKAYTREQILAMESIVLNALSFNLTVPSPVNFMQRFTKLANITPPVGQMYLVNNATQPPTAIINDQQNTMNNISYFLNLFLMELTLQHYQFLNYPPSMIAASSLYLTLFTVSQLSSTPFSWSSLSSSIDYSASQLQPCIQELLKVLEGVNTSKYRAVKKKYSHAQYLEVAKYSIKNPFA